MKKSLMSLDEKKQKKKLEKALQKANREEPYKEKCAAFDLKEGRNLEKCRSHPLGMTQCCGMLCECANARQRHADIAFGFSKIGEDAGHRHAREFFNSSCTECRTEEKLMRRSMSERKSPRSALKTSPKSVRTTPKRISQQKLNLSTTAASRNAYTLLASPTSAKSGTPHSSVIHGLQAMGLLSTSSKKRKNQDDLEGVPRDELVKRLFG
jgi:hypothetical protein